MVGSRRQRSKKEATFLESVKDALDHLNNEIQYIKFAITTPSSITSDTTGNYNQWHCESYDDWSAWNALGFNEDTCTGDVSHFSQARDATPKQGSLCQRAIVTQYSSQCASDRCYNVLELLAYRASCAGDIDDSSDLCTSNLVCSFVKDVPEAIGEDASSIGNASKVCAPHWADDCCSACCSFTGPCACGSIVLCSTCASLNASSPNNPDGPDTFPQDWEVIDEPLQTCLKTVRGTFPKIYKKFLEDEKEATGDFSATLLSSDGRNVAVGNVTESLIEVILSSVSSDRAHLAMSRCAFRIETTVKQGVLKMFDMVESRCPPSGNVREDAKARPFRLGPLTKRGMVQSSSKKQKKR